MAFNLTEDKILQLAPDDSSVKAAKGLATLGKWTLREYSGRAVWGHCQGSGKNPYQTVIDLRDIAFKCSCPSRKFPCKHGLGLLLLYARQPDLFNQAEEPDWVKSWLTKRTEKTEKKELKVKSDTQVDESAQAKRQEKRHRKVLAGISDLEIWMKDLLRNGFLNVPERAYIIFDNMARRMVDAQAPGLAGRLRAMQEIDFGSESWKSDLTEGMARLYLLVQSYRNIDSLSADWVEEIRTQIGYPQSKEKVLEGKAVTDCWLVLHRQSRKISDIATDIYWLYGKDSGLFARYLSFTVAGSIPADNLIPGCVYEGGLCFYNGTGICRRALLRESVLLESTFVPDFCRDLKEAAAAVRRAMASNPFSEEIPLLISDVTIVRNGKGYSMLDNSRHAVTVDLPEETYIDILAITGGQPFALFLLVNGDRWKLKSIWFNREYHDWKDENNRIYHTDSIARNL